MNLVMRLEAKLPQPSTNLKSLHLILTVGLKAVVGQLEELPLLVHLPHLTVNNLGHLLDLRMGFEQLATADSRLVRVLLSTSGKKLIDSSHLRDRPFYQTILRFQMSTGDRLAFDWLVTGRDDAVRWFLHLVKGHDTREMRHFDRFLLGKEERCRVKGEEARWSSSKAVWKISSKSFEVTSGVMLQLEPLSFRGKYPQPRNHTRQECLVTAQRGTQPSE